VTRGHRRRTWVSHPARRKNNEQTERTSDSRTLSHGRAAPSPQSLNGTTVGLFVYFENVDPVFNQAVASGTKVVMPLGDQFCGDRYGQITDPYGHNWSPATQIEDVSPEEMETPSAGIHGEDGSSSSAAASPDRPVANVLSWGMQQAMPRPYNNP
jgi:hypothetical protein